MSRTPKREDLTLKSKREREISKGPLKHVRSEKVHNNKRKQIGPRAREPGV